MVLKTLKLKPRATKRVYAMSKVTSWTTHSYSSYNAVEIVAYFAIFNVCKKNRLKSNLRLQEMLNSTLSNFLMFTTIDDPSQYIMLGTNADKLYVVGGRLEHEEPIVFVTWVEVETLLKKVKEKASTTIIGIDIKSLYPFETIRKLYTVGYIVP